MVPDDAPTSSAPKVISHVGCVYINYFNMSQFLERFRRSVKLFEFPERGGAPPSVGVFGGEFIQYRIIAARDGALNLDLGRICVACFSLDPAESLLLGVRLGEARVLP